MPALLRIVRGVDRNPLTAIALTEFTVERQLLMIGNHRQGAQYAARRADCKGITNLVAANRVLQIVLGR
jgi:hypothetical protein